MRCCTFRQVDGEGSLVLVHFMVAWSTLGSLILLLLFLLFFQSYHHFYYQNLVPASVLADYRRDLILVLLLFLICTLDGNWVGHCHDVGVWWRKRWSWSNAGVSKKKKKQCRFRSSTSSWLFIFYFLFVFILFPLWFTVCFEEYTTVLMSSTNVKEILNQLGLSWSEGAL